MAPQILKTFVKDGKTRTAYSPADVVALRFDGWIEQTDEAAADKAAPKPAPPAAKAPGTQAR